MSSKLYGAKSTLRRYTGVTLAYATTPDFEEPGATPAITYFTQVIEAVEELNEVAVEVASEAQATPAPTEPAQTLQELVQAGRIRLKQERARKDRDEWSSAVTHLQQIKSLLEA